MRVWLLLALFGGLIAGCESAGFELKPGAKSILDVFSPPTPTDAAKWAIDPFDADKRYRGTLLLANAPFANDPLYVQLFVDNAKDKDPGVRAAATRGLGTHGSPEHVPLIVERLKDEDPTVRTEAARALQRLHNDVAIDPLLAALDKDKETEPEVRLEAASALGQYAENRVVEQLIQALMDDNLAVNMATQSSLRTLTGQDFGLDNAAWRAWYNSTHEVFAARSVYVYPVFYRPKHWYEHLPLVPGPPNEPEGTPVGLVPGVN
jgi:hypothetical protein